MQQNDHTILLKDLVDAFDETTDVHVTLSFPELSPSSICDALDLIMSMQVTYDDGDHHKVIHPFLGWSISRSNKTYTVYVNPVLKEQLHSFIDYENNPTIAN